jgi:hypothetical protein
MALRLRHFSKNARWRMELVFEDSFSMMKRPIRPQHYDPEGDEMPDLSTQIGTLYRVIGQSGPASGSDRRYDSHFRVQDRATPLVSGRWICSLYCLWFSLPLSIWLSSGWIGLLLYWQALSGAACLVERFRGKPKPVLAGVDSGDGDVSWSTVEIEAR